MNEVVWEGRQHGMLANGSGHSEMNNIPSVRHNASRSQDDAMVGYFFQRPQTDPDFQNYNKQARWALGDDSVLEVRGDSELESDFQALALETGHPLEIPASAKKLWEDSGPKPEDSKGIFLADQWRDPTWSTGHNAASEHAVSQPIMVQRRSGSYPGSDANTMLSPRSSDTGGLGVKMVEYVLGSSPITKDLDSRMTRLHVGLNPDPSEKGKKNKNFDGEPKGKESEPSTGVSVIQANGILQNGLDDDKGFKCSKMHDISSCWTPVDASSDVVQSRRAERHKRMTVGKNISRRAVSFVNAATAELQNVDCRTPGSRQPSPSEDDVSKNPSITDVTKLSKHTGEPLVVPQAPGMPPGGSTLGGLDSGFEHVGIDPLQFDYPSHLMQPMDSPGMLDYSTQRNERTPPLLSHLYQQHRSQAQGQTLPILGQQQYSLPTQQQGQGLGVPQATPAASATPYTSNPYILNQDPYTPMGTIMAGPTVLPQYYGMAPWGMFPTPAPGMMQGGQGQHQGPTVQQQLLRGGGATRPMTPQGAGGDTLPQGGGTVPPSMQGPGGQYQMLAPPYYDQNGSMMMGSTRGMGTAMRLVPPVLVNPASAAPNNPGNINTEGLRLLGSQGQVQNQTASLFSSNASNATNNTLYTSAPNSSLGYNTVTSGIGFSGNSGSQLGFTSGLGIAPGQAQGNVGYGSSAFGPIGTSALGSLGTGMSGNVGSPRRDSFERRDTPLGSTPGGNYSNALDNQFSRQVAQPKSGQFYGPVGTVTASPGPGPIGMLPPSQSLTPPPSLNGSSSNLNIGALGGRMLSAAPGAEAKYMVRNGPLTSNMFGSTNSLFPSRSLQRNSSLDKATGRSRLLEDFRNNRYPNLQLRDLANHIVEFSQDQHGSRFIQQKLERATPAEKQMVFNEILGAAYGLMTDVFGNYVIQKFFEFGSPEQKQALAQKVKGHVLPLALQMYGCRVIQKALESIPPEQQKEVVKELDGHVLKCVKDQNGNHVVQKCIECVDPLALQFIINAFQGQVFALSTHPYGCRVIQRILEHCTPEQTAPILEELHQHTEQLVQDQYGNYVVQHVLEHGCLEDKSKIVSVVRGKVLQLSQHKFASNVVEKCVTHACRGEKAMLIEEVCSFNDGPHSALYTMMKDQFANYVVQKMIEVAEPPQRKLLLHKIRPHIPSLRKYTYGKHILAKLEKYLLKNNDLGPIGAPPNGAI